MRREYFETQFITDDSSPLWPDEFAILSAYATSGERWPKEKNEAADRNLDLCLRQTGVWMRRVIGASPTTPHAEPSWAVELPFAQACDLGLKFLQEAIYYVKEDLLFVSYCDKRRKLVEVGSFRERLK